MKLRPPSPSMGVAFVALVLASTGTAVATHSYVSNAGAVDRLSAVGASSTLEGAAGRLVATARGGSSKGMIPAKFLAGVMKGANVRYGKTLDVIDNQTGAPVTLASVPGIGTLTVNCADEANQAGTENPSSTVTFLNGSGAVINRDRRSGTGTATIGVLAAAAQDAFTINGSNTFDLHVANSNADVRFEGVVRQDGSGTATAVCFVYGTVTYVP